MREAVQHHRVVRRPRAAACRGCRRSASRVWIDQGQARVAGQPDLGGEGAALRLGRRVVAVVVEAALADRDHAGVARRARAIQTASRVVKPSASCGWTPTAAQTSGCASASATARSLDARPIADRRRSRSTPAATASATSSPPGRVARVEVGVGVDYAASSSTRGKSGRRGATVAPGVAGAPAPRRASETSAGVLAQRGQDALGRRRDDRPEQDRDRPAGPRRG